MAGSGCLCAAIAHWLRLVALDVSPLQGNEYLQPPLPTGEAPCAWLTKSDCKEPYRFETWSASSLGRSSQPLLVKVRGDVCGAGTCAVRGCVPVPGHFPAVPLADWSPLTGLTRGSGEG